MDKLIQTVPHLAFEVLDLDYELANRELRVVMIEHNGAPIELIEFEKE